MLTHAQIWKAIDRLAEACGYSTSGLARRAGLDATTFNRSKRVADGKERWPSSESVAKILNVTGTTLGQFVALMDDNARHPFNAPRTIPMVSLKDAGRENLFDSMGRPVEAKDEVLFPNPEAASAAHLFALEVTGDALLPLYRAGDTLVVAPGMPVRRGDRVVLRRKTGEVMVAEFVRQTAARVDLKSLGASPREFDVDGDSLSWLSRIVWASQ